MSEPVKKGLGPRFTAVFLAGALVGALSIVQVVPDFVGTGAPGVVTELGSDSALSGDIAVATETVGGGKASGGKQKGSDAAAAPTSSGGDAALPPSKPGLECAPGRNGGATDQGVTATSIAMATTVAESGPGSSFLGEVRFGMEAVKNRVNSGGGVCGRALAIEYRDDGWNAQTGAQYLRNFIQQGIFAIPVGPSSEGLRVVIESGDIDKAKVPVVGTDGLLQSQYTKPDGLAQPWVWPVAAATVSSARVMAAEAYKRGARDFSVVFEKNYRFGVEAAAAFNAHVKKLTGKPVPGYNTDSSCVDQFCGIEGGSSSYSQDAARFVEGDFVALFLEPQTAQSWMGDPNTAANKDIKYGYGAAQPLFTYSFGHNCGAKCNGMQVWTGFKPPIESYRNDPAVKQYVSDLKRTKPDADEFNAFTEGGYLGMQLLEAALRKVGPDLTRDRLKAALDSMCLKTGLLIRGNLCYSPDNRFANTYMQAFQMQYSGTFGGWRSGPIVQDPGV
jgi:ABC-type branched-subunit amino acid transport system substrate-binding protein